MGIATQDIFMPKHPTGSKRIASRGCVMRPLHGKMRKRPWKEQQQIILSLYFANGSRDASDVVQGILSHGDEISSKAGALKKQKKKHHVLMARLLLFINITGPQLVIVLLKMCQIFLIWVSFLHNSMKHTLSLYLRLKIQPK